MTKDLALCVSEGKELKRNQYCSTEEFMKKCSEILRQNLKSINQPKL